MSVETSNIIAIVQIFFSALILPVFWLLFNLSTKVAKLEGKIEGFTQGQSQTAREMSELLTNAIRAAMSTPNERILAGDIERRRLERSNA